ncbi:cadherin EGF LAG seven-pass G-type receptor 2-like [Orbicella faveolata]|uniref:cadherin EGF LAG seven-pass G-type receptor 2-like n=1 Tax=Orbicella faveolata TaxID=48498 RepID=UPI0009E42756|nr:cadherin EGF LAG seven-pass G-type receptor 2-like [Orbicella faveolata]
MFKLKDAYHCSVLVAKALDFESRSSYVLNITASNYQEGFSNWTVLSISVADEDDLPARFSTYEYRTIITEDAFVGTSVIQVIATDQDTINEPVTYEIIGSTNKHSLFAINETTGVISLNGTLDREAVSNYRLRVLAYSSFHLPDHAAVEIEVGDVNDHMPIFTNKYYSFVIRENAQIDATVGQVMASDADKGNNATFAYYLLDGGGDLAIDPNTGVLTVNGSLDREKQEYYNFLVFAGETQTVEMYSSNVTVEVRVEDRNDNSPRFVEPFYEVTVKEEQPSGTPILQVFANDSDATSNAYVTYSLVPDVNNHSLDFSISPVNGTIRSAKQLDRETISEYYLTVKAENDAVQSQRRSSTVTVKVTLEDINDHVPIFDEQFYTETATEVAAVNSTILTVKATDKDFGGNGAIRYSLEDGNIGNVFKIDELSGTVILAEDLDRETVDVYKLVITAKDGGNRSTTVNLTVFVSDVNDNSPQFTLPGGYQFSVAEGVVGLTVGAVKANDSDIAGNGEIFYSLMATPTSISFRINSSTGGISTTEALDYEKFHSHLLIVQAEDRGIPQPRRTAVQVSINVIDVNDNAPRFYETQHDLNTVENNLFCPTYNTTDFTVIRVQDLTPANVEIGRVTSFDRDEADNAKIFYRIEGSF